MNNARLLTLAACIALLGTFAYAQDTGSVNICFNSLTIVENPGSQNASVGVPYSLQINATDPNADNLTYADNTSLFIINATTGLINFTPNISHIGIHNISINITEQTSCQTNIYTTSFQLTITNGTAVCGDGNVTSPEQCDDNNTVSGDGCSSVCLLEVCGDGTVQTGLGEQCDDNNTVSGDGCSATCQTEAAGGGGGGGGGGCTPNWICNDWGPCIDSTQTRSCTDQRNCNNIRTRPILTQSCTSYVATCYDGVRNQGETGIDCGGLCGPCQTCTDGILNQNEQDVDCGGVCPSCATCTDRTQNQGETGIDCGGPCGSCLTPALQIPASYVRGFCVGSMYGVCLTTTIVLFLACLLGILIAISTWPKKPYWKKIEAEK